MNIFDIHGQLIDDYRAFTSTPEVPPEWWNWVAGGLVIRIGLCGALAARISPRGRSMDKRSL
jgi:hypothetical protein